MVHKSSSLAGSSGGGVTSLQGQTGAETITSSGGSITITTPGPNTINIESVSGGAGTVTSVSGVTTNGFAFSITNPTSTPAITATTTITGVLQGNGTAISAVPNGGISNALLANSAITVDAGVGLTGGGSVALGGSITLGLTSSSVTVSGVSGVTGGGTVALGSAITLGMADSIANTLAGYNNSGVFADVSIGSNLSLSGGILNGTVGPAPVTSVFTRTGAIVADWNDYQFNLIGGTASVSQGGTGQTSLTAHSVLLGEGAVTGIGFATTGIAARILIDQGGVDPSFQVLSGDSSLASNGNMVNLAVHGVTYPSSPSIGFVPIVTGTNIVTYEYVPNASLLNSSLTVASGSGLSGGGSVALGSSITLGLATALPNGTTATTQAATDNSALLATDQYVTTAITNALAAINPAVAVQYATTQASDTSSLTYNNGVSGIGATFTGANNATTSMDGHTFVVGDVGVTRVLIKNDTQSPSGAFNGVYLFTALHTAGTGDIFTRAVDYDQPSDINNTGAIPVINGTVNASTSWVETAQIVTVGITPLVFAQFSYNPTTIITTSTAAGGQLTGTYPNPSLSSNQTSRQITFALDGQGSAIVSGGTWYLANTAFAGTITSWSLVADVSGSIDIDVWKSNAAVPTISNTITASAQCSLASSQSNFTGPITGWSSAISKGDCWGFNVVSASTLTKANLTIQVTAS